MKIVIDIPDGCYEELNNGQFPVQEAYRLVAWIKNGTPLPKEKTGKWIYREELFDDEDKPRMAYGCSICGHSIKSVHEKGNYCPSCGAKMVEPQESKDKENDTDGNS